MIPAIQRTLPFPYRAMLSICSDLDETPDRHRYLDIARFLNTDQDTPAGRGVGLEVGNTIYFDMPDEQFAYWNTDDAGRDMVRALIRSGHIDCFHSFGDLATDRAHAQRALEDLDRHGCRIECWVDHAVAPTNLGPDIMRGSGDVRGAPAYHADLTWAHGVRFVWRGRVTSIIGQNRGRSLRGIASLRNPRSSAKTLAVEAAKGALARLGSTKYGMHRRNDLLREVTLRDGHRVLEFIRCNPHWGGVSSADTGDGLGSVLTPAFVRRLIRRNGVGILYTHLGKSRSPDTLFGEATVTALRHLAKVQERGEVLVTTTRRLLGYCAATRYARVRVIRDGGGETVEVDTSALRELGLPPDTDGLAFYVNDPGSARIVVDGVECRDVQRNAADERGLQSVSIPWQRLAFPAF